MPLAIPLSRDGEPLSRQIYLWLRQAILHGTLSPGERLASSRELAEQLGVSRTVVLLAYDQLLAEGFAEARSGSGTYISSCLTSGQQKTAADPAELRLSRFGSATDRSVSSQYS